jgi:hypothetical protein
MGDLLPKSITMLNEKERLEHWLYHRKQELIKKQKERDLLNKEIGELEIKILEAEQDLK